MSSLIRHLDRRNTRAVATVAALSVGFVCIAWVWLASDREPAQLGTRVIPDTEVRSAPSSSQATPEPPKPTAEPRVASSRPVSISVETPAPFTALPAKQELARLKSQVDDSELKPECKAYLSDVVFTAFENFADNRAASQEVANPKGFLMELLFYGMRSWQDHLGEAWEFLLRELEPTHELSSAESADLQRFLEELVGDVMDDAVSVDRALGLGSEELGSDAFSEAWDLRMETFEARFEVFHDDFGRVLPPRVYDAFVEFCRLTGAPIPSQ